MDRGEVEKSRGTDPAAIFVGDVHRLVHERWAWGFIDLLGERGPEHPLNDEDLWTRVEIVLDGGGSILEVATVRSSGNQNFDIAAREVVLSAGPFPEPPETLRSSDGRVYMHWALHRDARACGPLGATTFILEDNPHPDPNKEIPRPNAAR